MNSFLDLIEKRLQALVEGSVDRIFNRNAAFSLPKRLTTLVEENIKVDPDGTKIAPDIIKIKVAKSKIKTWEESKLFLEQLAETLFVSAQEMGIVFIANPQILPEISSELKGETFELEASFSPGFAPLTETSIFSTIPLDRQTNHIPRNAFIIMDGKITHPLEKNLINIGRRSTCDIIVEDPQVSRNHLQLRANHGHFFLFDLDSTGGTFLNGAPCRSAVLRSGDIIRIGTTLLIYSQETTDLLPLTTRFEIE